MSKKFRYVGNELRMMLENGKPMASFCRAIIEDIDEFSEQDFTPLLKSGEVIKKVFYVKRSEYKLIYTVFVRPSELWRFFVFKALKKQNCSKWGEEQENLESFLLGYRSLPSVSAPD